MSEASASYESNNVRLSKREASIGVVALLSVGGFISSYIPHSGDANAAAVTQQVSMNTEDIKSLKDSRKQDLVDNQQFRQEIMQRLGAIDGRTIDMYHVLLDVQQAQAASAGKR